MMMNNKCNEGLAGPGSKPMVVRPAVTILKKNEFPVYNGIRAKGKVRSRPLVIHELALGALCCMETCSDWVENDRRCAQSIPASLCPLAC